MLFDVGNYMCNCWNHN